MPGYLEAVDVLMLIHLHAKVSRVNRDGLW